MPGAQLSRLQVVKNWGWQNRRDIFFGCVAFLAMAGVIRNELMRNGIIGRPRAAVETRPKVERTFGKSHRE